MKAKQGFRWMGRTYAGLNLSCETVKRNNEARGASTLGDWFWVTEHQLLWRVLSWLWSAESSVVSSSHSSNLLSQMLWSRFDYAISLQWFATPQIFTEHLTARLAHSRAFPPHPTPRPRHTYGIELYGPSEGWGNASVFVSPVHCWHQHRKKTSHSKVYLFQLQNPDYARDKKSVTKQTSKKRKMIIYEKLLM